MNDFDGLLHYAHRIVTYRIVETDAFGSDYPVEKFLDLPHLPKYLLETICLLINTYYNDNTHDRFYKVVESDYKLSKGFEP